MINMKNYLLIPCLLLLTFMYSCEKDANTCNTNPNTEVKFLNATQSFYYNSDNNLLMRMLPTKTALNVTISNINIEELSGIYASNNVKSIALLFNTSDTSVLNSFDEADLNGILFYVLDSVTNKLSTLVYKIESGNFIKNEYLSTITRYQA